MQLVFITHSQEIPDAPAAPGCSRLWARAGRRAGWCREAPLTLPPRHRGRTENRALCPLLLQKLLRRHQVTRGSKLSTCPCIASRHAWGLLLEQPARAVPRGRRGRVSCRARVPAEGSIARSIAECVLLPRACCRVSCRLWPAEGSIAGGACCHVSCQPLAGRGQLAKLPGSQLQRGLQASAGAAAEPPRSQLQRGLRPQESEKIKATRYALDAFVAKTHRPSASGG